MPSASPTRLANFYGEVLSTLICFDSEPTFYPDQIDVGTIVLFAQWFSLLSPISSLVFKISTQISLFLPRNSDIPHKIERKVKSQTGTDLPTRDPTEAPIPPMWNGRWVLEGSDKIFYHALFDLFAQIPRGPRDGRDLPAFKCSWNQNYISNHLENA